LRGPDRLTADRLHSFPHRVWSYWLVGERARQGLALPLCPAGGDTGMTPYRVRSEKAFQQPAIFWPWASESRRLSSVVLPEPRKPVRIVTGISAINLSFKGINTCAAARCHSARPPCGGTHFSVYRGCQALSVH